MNEHQPAQPPLPPHLGLPERIFQALRSGPRHPTPDQTREGVRFFFIFFMFGALVWMIVLSWANSSLSMFGSLGMISAAATIAGAFLGFLFGVPRSLASTTAALAELSPAVAGEATTSKVIVAPNTNLEQISDWLTKVLVGVGLTQLQKVPTVLSDLAVNLSSVLPNVPAGGTIMVATIIAFLFAGFLWSYFESRTALMSLFNLGH